MNKLLHLSLAACAVLTLAACGGDSSTNTDTDTIKKIEDVKIDKNTITGRVVDGYIKGAKVFFDYNQNNTWDENEPKSTTDEFGRYKLNNIDPTKANFRHSIIAIGGIDTDTNKELKTIYRMNPSKKDLNAPIFITPLSSFQVSLALKIVSGGSMKGVGHKNFSRIIAENFGLDEKDLYKDPLAEGNEHIYKANVALQKSIEILSSDNKSNEILDKLAEFIEDGKTFENALTLYYDETNNEKVSEAKKLVEFYKNVSIEDIKNKRINIAKIIQKNVDNKSITIKIEDIKNIKKDIKTNNAPDLIPNVEIEGKSVDVSGKVISLYPYEATVFLDKNKNRLLDQGEANTSTDKDGNYTLTVSEDDLDRMKGNSIVSIGGLNEKNEAFDGILFASSGDGSTNNLNLTPLSTFKNSSAIALFSGISMPGIFMTTFSKAASDSLDIELDKFSNDYRNADANLKLYKVSNALQDIVKALSLGIKNDQTLQERMVNKYLYLSSSIQDKAGTIDSLLTKYQESNNINENIITIAKDIYKLYDEASVIELKTQEFQNKINEQFKKAKDSAIDETRGKLVNLEFNHSEDTKLPKDEFSKYQWHLNDTGSVVNTHGIYTLGGNDLNVKSLYAKGIVGKGVHVRVVDDGVEYEHEDLKNRIDLANSYNAETALEDGKTTEEINDPTSSKIEDSHGTQVAGLIAADGSNNIGLRGVAPYATLSAFKLKTPTGGGLDFDLDELKIAWLGGDDKVSIVNNSWGSSIDKYEEYEEVMKEGATNMRSGTGTREGEKLGRMYLIAAGNGGFNQGTVEDYVDDAVTSYLRNSQYAITVAAVRNENVVTQYSTQGSNVLVSGYGGGVKNNTSALMATTTRTGQSKTTWNDDKKKNYTFGFDGTSAATPVTSGALALVMGECPNLSYRDVKWLIAHHSKKIDINYENKTIPAPNVPAYKTTPVLDLDNGFGYVENAAGLSHSNYYGFGLVNPKEMIEACTADNFEFLPERLELTKITENTNDGSLISNDDNTSLEMIRINSDKINKTEWVGITIYSTIKNLEKVSIKLISPQGTVSRILTNSKTAFEGRADLENGYRFSSVAFVDENPRGTWKLEVTTSDNDEKGRITKLELNIVGYKKD